MTHRQLIAKGLVLGMFFTNISTYSFANDINLEENKYAKEISDIETKEDLQKSAQKAVKSGEVDTWIEGLASMPTKRAYLASAVVDGKIYCIGGYNGSSSYSNKVEVYDPKTDTWETKANMPTGRRNLTSAVVNGKIYVIGGLDGSSYLNKVEVYDPKTDTWETKANMPTSRDRLTSAVVDGKIYCIGGNNSSSSYLNKVEVYDPVTDSWETKSSMPTKRSGFTSTVVDGKIYCIAGYNTSSTYLNIVEVYNPTTDSWETKSSMFNDRGYLTSAIVDGKIYCIGGWSGSSYLNTVEVYNPATDSWEIKSSMPTKRYSLVSEVVDGKIYCIGGYNNGSYLNTVEAYIAKVSPEQEAKDALDEAEQTRDPIDIEDARDLVNQLEESELKNNLQDRLNAIVSNLSLTPQSATSNIDIYIKSENMLSLSLDTNSVTFEDFSGVEDLEKQNAVTLTINSSLPYEINSYLVSEMKNADKSETMDKSILNIKANSSLTYESFTDLVTPIKLFDNQVAGNNKVHGIDLKLKGSIAHKADAYKTTIKFEVNQK